MSTTLIGFTLISIAVCASPGPSMFYVLSSGLTGNKRIAMASVLGITLANVVWVALSASGLAALIYQSHIAFNILRISGAVYLVYTGVRIWKNGVGNNSIKMRVAGLLNTFFKAMATSLSNPKALIFYLSFFPQFIIPNEPFFPQVVVLGTISVSVVFVVMSTYALLGKNISVIIRKEKIMRLAGKIISAVFVLTGLSLFKVHGPGYGE